MLTKSIYYEGDKDAGRCLADLKSDAKGRALIDTPVKTVGGAAEKAAYEVFFKAAFRGEQAAPPFMDGTVAIEDGRAREDLEGLKPSTRFRVKLYAIPSS